MPNWCNNKLVIYGSEHALTSFMSAAKNEETKFSMGVFFPMPDEIRNTNSPSRATEEEKQDLINRYGAEDWYGWAINNWGTKWDFSAESVSEEYQDGEVEIDFETAWGPPDKFMEKLAAKFPNLAFVHMYAESGMGFGGQIFYRNGEIANAHSADTSQDTAMLSEWHALMVGEDWDDVEKDVDEDEDESGNNNSNEGGE